MRKLFLILMLLIPFVSAEEAGQVLVEAKVYKVDKLHRAISLKELLAGATLEFNPRLLTNYGKETELRFDYQNEKGSERSVLEILMLPDQSSKTYNIDINLLNKDNENISRIYDHPIGQLFIASTVIEDASRVIQIDVSESKPAMATFVLQVSSNLNCESLAIELNALGQEQHHYLEYTTKAFASVSMPEGKYSFGSVNCRTKEGQQTFDVLHDKLMPLAVDSGQTYYGGRLIFREEVEQVVAEGLPNILDSCTRLYSNARGKKTDNLCDGAGVKSEGQTSRRIEVYMPEVADEDIAAMKQALSTSGDLLQHLPLKLKKNVEPVPEVSQ